MKQGAYTNTPMTYIPIAWNNAEWSVDMSEPTAESIAQSSAASTGALPDTTATPLTEIDIPDTLRENLALFLRLDRTP